MHFNDQKQIKGYLFELGLEEPSVLHWIEWKLECSQGNVDRPLHIHSHTASLQRAKLLRAHSMMSLNTDQGRIHILLWCGFLPVAVFHK